MSWFKDSNVDCWYSYFVSTSASCFLPPSNASTGLSQLWTIIDWIPNSLIEDKNMKPQFTQRVSSTWTIKWFQIFQWRKFYFRSAIQRIPAFSLHVKLCTQLERNCTFKTLVFLFRGLGYPYNPHTRQKKPLGCLWMSITISVNY